MTAAQPAVSTEWRFCQFGLIVTGKCEEHHLPKLFRSLAAKGYCHFRVIRRIGQRDPITSPQRKLRMVGRGQTIPNKDAEEIGFPARRFIQDDQNAFVIVIDDLEHARVAQAAGVFARYRRALDEILRERKSRASVHFLVPMLETYYFAHADALNGVLGTSFRDFDGDVEKKRNPKSEIRAVCPAFDGVDHEGRILDRLDVEHVLFRPDTCASLRTMFVWCARIRGLDSGEPYRLDRGALSVFTGSQLSRALE